MTNPQAEVDDLLAKLADPWWRITSGVLYKIIIKGEDDSDTLVIPFVPNHSQLRLLRRLHHRNLILKARQLGFTTLVAIVWLDHALFNANSRCGIIAQDREAAEVIFRDKVKFAYEHLPPELRVKMPLKADNASELLFAHNNSSIRVATSMRAGTIHRLHISEFGKICAKYPDKAVEVVTGSIPAVPENGILIIESTAEGQEGEYYKMTQRAMALQQQGKKLTRRDYRFHFFPWWQAPEYTLDDPGVVMTDRDRLYFERIEGEAECTLTPGQRAWYVNTRDSDFSGKEERMWQEYPSTPSEAFKTSTEGVYYANELAVARKQGRVLKIPVVDVPVDTFWDIGRRDSTAIWFVQLVGMEYRLIRYYEASGERLGHFIKYLQDTGYMWGHHYLPHDAAHKRLSDTNKSTEEMLNDLGLVKTVIVPRIDNEQDGINATRALFSQLYFDEDGTSEGLARLANFRKSWNKSLGAWRDEPVDDDNCHGADALRQLAQAVEGGIYIRAGSSKSTAFKRRGSPMAA